MKIIFAAAISVAVLSADAENLLENASFELPKITGATRVQDGGDPAKAESATSWADFTTGEKGREGKIVVGMTDQIARTGKQSVFIDFPKVTEQAQRADLPATLISIKPAKPYRLSMWGRIDRERPLTLDERRPHVWVYIAFFQADGETRVGDPVLAVKLIPGGVIAGRKPDLVFVSSKWSEFAAEVTSPEGAAFIQVIWSWVIGKDEGETDGVIYWDDAAVEGERGSALVEEKPEPKAEDFPATSKDSPGEKPSRTPKTPAKGGR